MNKLFKSLLLTLSCGLLLAGGVQAQPSVATCPDSADGFPEGAMPLGLDEISTDFTSVGACYIPWLDGVVVIDSIECSIHFLVRNGDTMRCYGTFVTDRYKGRHDLTKIVRPKSVGLMDGCIILLASSSDSSFLALFPLDEKQVGAEMQPCAMIGFNSNAYAFRVLQSGEILVMGKNALGYDIHYVSGNEDLTELTSSCSSHYHVARQAESIQASDPAGVGLTVVAVLVVFLLLTSICFIMKGFAAGVTKMQNRAKAPKNAAVKESKGEGAADSTEEVYAAIAAAIYAYNEELHDEENTIITIQKVERSWTPWNAKFYNMNQYFNNRR